MKRGLAEKIQYALNPMPDVTEAELIAKAGNLDMLEPSARGPFDVIWPYAFGADRETVRLKPGQYIPLRESETKDFLKMCGEIGMVIVNDPQDKREVRAASLNGLRTAAKFYRDRGAVMIANFRKSRGITKQEMDEDYAYDYWPYYLNKAKAEVIEESIKQLHAEAQAEKPRVPTDTPSPAKSIVSKR